jgi:hypothetical protein
MWSSIAKWGVAAVVFVAIGLVDMRFGHAIGLASLIAVLVLAYVLDVRAREPHRGETDHDDPLPRGAQGPGPDPDEATPETPASP